MSFKPEVIADSTAKWAGNATRFATEAEAKAYVQDLSSRWLAVRDHRVVECEDPITYAWDFDAGRAIPLKPGDVA